MFCVCISNVVFLDVGDGDDDDDDDEYDEPLKENLLSFFSLKLKCKWAH